MPIDLYCATLTHQVNCFNFKYDITGNETYIRDPKRVCPLFILFVYPFCCSSIMIHWMNIQYIITFHTDAKVGKWLIVR